ncbi:Quinoprotein glucose dehydrogenase B precursor [Symmachiella macrocystis]|uniref:Quinoprotein glucose dehydrogenase B n=1 Tax=Symmachiella macrocystis TaxID=2527985 RepID=A0A5C6BAD6_9PLAN|nr:PQQ-dependent sugar dehydrogenase [Symmachiella macrocystis]TWU08938.1 Quinoprotein glucose dehydrogenase B precursor [Symmachiella macrocystis]
MASVKIGLAGAGTEFQYNWNPYRYHFRTHYQMLGKRKQRLGRYYRHFYLIVLGLIGLFSLTGHQSLTAEQGSSTKSGRALWTTSRIHGTPDPPPPYQLESAFPELNFDEPLAVSLIPGTNRFLLCERNGKLFTFEDAPHAKPKLLIDLERTVYGAAAHPDFVNNGRLFVVSIVKEGAEDGTRLSRFETSPDDRFHSKPQSEVVLLSWLAGGHNGGCVRFGPDGLLYVSTGDGSGWADWHLTGQRIDDFLASILRIDVDHSMGDKSYAIPVDNPFIKTPNASPEVYSYGHRNVWKFSFDSEGRLWAGDVGQDLWEMIELVQPGGNYGWSIKEGTHDFKPDRQLGPTPIQPPLLEHPHSESRSITGGYIWEADEPADLHGCYIYGDYDTGKIWSVRLVDGQPTKPRQLADTQFRIVAFAQNQQGEVLVVDHVSGTLQRLVPAPLPDENEPKFPRMLSETGLFVSTTDHIPQPGLIPYSVNAPLWSDGASKERFIARPGDSQILFDDVTYPAPPPGWRFSDGTVLVKTFSMEMEAGNPLSTRRLETRLLHFKSMPGDRERYGAQFWRGYTYVWNDDQTDAVLLDAQGADRVLNIQDKNAPGGVRKQTWHFPSRAECTLCHTMAAKYALGVNTLQMNRLHDYGDGQPRNQLAQLEEWGVFAKPLPKSPDALPRLADYHDQSQSINDRARSYLHANCSHCHRLWGGGLTEFQLPADLPLDKTGLIHATPERGHYGITDARLIAPGDPDRSLLSHRMTLLKIGRMPHIGSNVIDEEGVELLREWIRQMK